MSRALSKNDVRIRIHSRIRKRIHGAITRPRLNVYRSNKHIYAQIIDDDRGATLTSASTLDPTVKAEVSNGGNKAAAKVVGRLIAERAREKGIEAVLFDRGGYLYHGRIQVLAEAAREAGLKF